MVSFRRKSFCCFFFFFHRCSNNVTAVTALRPREWRVGSLCKTMIDDDRQLNLEPRGLETEWLTKSMSDGSHRSENISGCTLFKAFCTTKGWNNTDEPWSSLSKRCLVVSPNLQQNKTELLRPPRLANDTQLFWQKQGCLSALRPHNLSLWAFVFKGKFGAWWVGLWWFPCWIATED